MPHVIESSVLQNPDAIPGELKNLAVLAVMPATDLLMAQRAANLMVQRAGIREFDVLIVMDTESLGFIHIANKVFSGTQSGFFIYTAQDAFVGRNWLKIAINCIQSQQKGLLAFNDGKWNGLLASFGLVRRAWILSKHADQPLFYPGYESHYADVELSLIAMQANQYCFDPLSLMVEVDWNKDVKAVNPADKLLFAQRKKGLFDGRVSRFQLLDLFN